MRAMIILLSLLLYSHSWATSPCTAQDYSDSKKAPSWSCPGPEEGILVPDIKFNPSIGIGIGDSIFFKGKTKATPISYPALVMDKDKVIQLGIRIQGLRRLRWLERHKYVDVLDIERKYISDRLTAKLELEQSRTAVAIGQRDAARKELSKARRWYRSWTFGVVCGVIVSTVTAVAVIYSAKKWNE